MFYKKGVRNLQENPGKTSPRPVALFKKRL